MFAVPFPKPCSFLPPVALNSCFCLLGLKAWKWLRVARRCQEERAQGGVGTPRSPQGEERSRLPLHRHRRFGVQRRGRILGWALHAAPASAHEPQIPSSMRGPPKITHAGTVLLFCRCHLIPPAHGAPGRGDQHPLPVPGAGAARQQRFPGTHGQPGETGRARCQQTGCCLFTQPRCGAERQRNPPRLWFPHWVPLRNANSFLCCRFSPHAKRSSGITAPRSDSPESVGAAGQGNTPCGKRVERAALRVRAAHGAPGAGEALGGDFPLGPAPSIPGEPAEGSAPGGKALKVTPKPTLCLVSAKEGEGLRGEGQEGISRNQSLLSRRS